jgi:hypothetical protein
MRLHHDRYNVANAVRSNWFFTTDLSLTIGLPWQMGVGSFGSYSTRRLISQGYLDPLYTIDAVFVTKKFRNLNVFVALRSVAKSNEVSYIINDPFIERSVFDHKTFGIAFRVIYFFNTGKKYRMEKIDTLHEMDKK